MLDSLLLLKLLGGLILGLVVSSIGAGGSLLAIPILEDMYFIPPEHASILSLLVVAIVYIVALILHYKELSGWFKNKGFHLSILYGFFGAIVANISSRYGHEIHEPSRSLYFAMLLNLACVIMILNSVFLEGKTANQIGLKQKKGLASVSYVIVNAIAASILGALTGIFGVGGGFLLVPVIIFVAKVSFNYAVICSFVIATVNSLSGLSATYSFLSIDEVMKAIILAFFGILGIFASFGFRRYVLQYKNKETFEKISKYLYAIIIFALSIRYYVLYFSY